MTHLSNLTGGSYPHCSTRHRWMSPQPTEWLCRWSAAQENHRGLDSHHSSSLRLHSDFQNQSESCHLQNNHLILNVNKTKEMIVDFRGTRNKSNHISIMEKKWRWWRSINTSVFTWTTDWTGDTTLMLFRRRNRADFTSGGS